MLVWVQVPSPADAEVAELADAHGSGPCGSNTLWVRLPSSACRLRAGNLDFIGFSAIFILQTSSERKCLNMVARQDFDGLIIDGVKASLINPNLDCYYNLYHQKLPVVFYNNYYKDLKFPRVINNDQRCAREMIYRMTQDGHRRVAGIIVYDNYQSTEKYQGYVRALPRFGAEFDDDYVKWRVSNEAHDLSYAKEITRFIRAIPKCTAIVCCNYMIPRTVLMVLKKAGKKIPEDYSVVCFDYSGKDWEQTHLLGLPGFLT